MQAIEAFLHGGQRLVGAWFGNALHKTLAV